MYPNVLDVTEEIREKALQRTAAVLRKIDEVRKQLELPVDQLPVVVDLYGQVVLALIAEEERKKMTERVTTRLPITMRSEDREYQPLKIKAGKTFDVVVRPQTAAFRPEEIEIHGDRSHWLVHDIRVGNRSQFASKHGPAPGTDFGPDGICEKLKLETCQSSMDLALVVEYVGPDPEGKVFEATIVGAATDF